MIGRFVTASPWEALVYAWFFLFGCIALASLVVVIADWTNAKQVSREIERSRKERTECNR